METNHQIDYENFEIIDKANNDLKLSYKEMLHIRKQKSTLNARENSELFTLITRNVQLDNAITRDAEKYNKNHSKQTL